MKRYVSKLLILFGWSILACTNIGFANATVPNNAVAITNKHIENQFNHLNPTSESSPISLEPEVIPIPKQSISTTNIMAMWKTPIPYLSVGYTIANVNINPSNGVTINNDNYNGMAFELRGF